MPHTPHTPKIIFEDVHLMVLSKPAGLLSQGEHTGDANVVDWLRERLGRPYVGLVHRLDRNTSGLMVVAKRTKAAQRLTESLQKDELKRVYRAWVVGRVPAAARWEHQLLKDERTNTVRVVRAARSGGGVGGGGVGGGGVGGGGVGGGGVGGGGVGGGGVGGGGVGGGGHRSEAKRAVLSVQPVKYSIFKNQWEVTLAEFVLETGRSHQIRVQSAAEGFPLLGDRKYSGRLAVPDFPRTALHSFRLSFPHPMTKEEMVFEDQWPEDLKLD